MLDILQPQRERKVWYPHKLARNKHDYIEGEDRFFYVLSIIDYHMGPYYTGQNDRQASWPVQHKQV